jgi:signal transduction histidine kinase
MLAAAARDEEHRRIIEQLELRSYIGVPLMYEEKPFGVITLVMAESKRRYGAEDLKMARSLADRASTAVEHARLFRAAERARHDAMRANRAKDEFLAMLGHELRNPLAPIRTALDLMRHRPGEDHRREYGVIERQVDHVLRHVDDLLDVSRITRGRIELSREPVLLVTAVERAFEMLWPGGTKPEQHVAIEVSRDLVVHADPIRLAQIMANLLSNAAKYTPGGGHIWVEGRHVEDKIELRVRDDGMGIGPETLEHVFDIFVQEPQALDRAHGGLGLGLAIVRGLVAAHDGTVAAHSAGISNGAEFVVTLPTYDAERESARDVAPKSPRPEPTRI